MYVTGNIEQLRGNLIALQRYVCKKQVTQADLFLHHDAMSCILLLAQHIMISPNQRKCTLGKMANDLSNNFPVIVVETVKKVAKKVRVFRLEDINQVNELLCIPKVGPQGYGQSGAAEVVDFTKMEVGDYQGLPLRNP